MKRRLSEPLSLIRDAIARHGGGFSGLRSIINRGVRVLRVLGWKGFKHRIATSRQRPPDVFAIPETIVFSKPVALEQMDLSVGIMAHVFYPDLLDELAGYLANMPVPFMLMLSVTDDAVRTSAILRMRRLPNIQGIEVRVVPNRGRDIAPFLLTFRQEILALDLVCHVHTKKSLYSGKDQAGWRQYLLHSLLGSDQRLAWILGMFKAMPSLGMIYPESFSAMPLWAHTWLGNAESARMFGNSLGIAIDTSAYLDYPAGSMFWARTRTLLPLFQLGLSLESFPEERGQNDGTIQHAIERLLTLVVRRTGSLIGVLPANGQLRLTAEGSRNWDQHFQLKLRDKIAYAALEARIISFDLFDTMVLRPFLHPKGALLYLEFLVQQRFGISDFAEFRLQAEASARARAGRDVCCNEIYAALKRIPTFADAPLDDIQALEIETEKRILRPRMAILAAAREQAEISHKRIIAVSDTYYARTEIEAILPPEVTRTLREIYVSCDTGLRKDGNVWGKLEKTESVPARQWLHIGDNEHSDVQRPQALGFINPVHVLRPGALFDVVPALRVLRPREELRSQWQTQLLLGLIANRLTELSDSQPEAFAPTFTLNDPVSFGYIVVGPMILDYLAWLARTVVETGSDTILFLSREGYLLKRVFEHIHAAVPSLKHIKYIYLLASRRGVTTPALQTPDDLTELFTSPYTGTLAGLLDARLGEGVALAAEKFLGQSTLAEEVYLPAMKAEIAHMLKPAAEEILEIAREEREAYLHYWRGCVDEHAFSVVSDLGYAATIQKQLMKLTGSSLGGAYFAVKSEAQETGLLGGWARGRFQDSATSVPSPAMSYHLLLESVMTSPDGQFSHFKASPEGPRAIFRQADLNLEHWNTIERMHGGAEDFVLDALNVAGADIMQLSFDPSLVQQPLRCVGSSHWKLGAWASTLHVEDKYSGRGNVATHPT